MAEDRKELELQLENLENNLFNLTDMLKDDMTDEERDQISGFLAQLEKDIALVRKKLSEA